MLIDFSVLQSKTYSFFIENELCEIVMERKGNRFFYDFEINREVDTPLNRARNQLEKKHWYQSLLFFGGMFLMIGVFTFIFLSFKSSRESNAASLLHTKSDSTLARVQVIPEKDDTYTILYAFVANGKKVEGKVEQGAMPLFQNKLPLETGDELAVAFAPKNPKVHQLDFDRTDKIQMDRFLERIFQFHLTQNSSLTKEMVRCQVEIAYELAGAAGLAHLYFQNTSPSENEQFNELTFQRFVRDIPFKNRVQERCW